MRSNLFAEFPATTKADWQKQITKDLKGKPLEELDWQIEEQIRLSPLYTADDIPTLPPLAAGRLDNGWEIGDVIEVTDMAQANAQAHEALNGGVNAPLFQLRHEPTAAELAVLVAGIRPEMITANFAPHHPGKDPAELYRDLIYYVRRQGYRLADIAGSVDFDPLLDWSEPPFDPLARIIGFAHRQTPRFKVLQVNARTFDSGVENTSRELALTVAKAIEYLDQMEKRGIAPAVTNAHLQFALTIGNAYFINIAKIRALRLLWANVLDAYGLPQAALPPVVAHFEHESQTEDQYANMIRAAAQAMSAVIGGASRLYVLPANYFTHKENADGFVRRIARNVQHLLQMESGFDRVIDPAAGSYFIDTLTQSLAAEAWEKLAGVEAGGGFWEATEV